MGIPPASDSSIFAPSSKGASPRAWPPGFRFHPTDEELVLYYLKRKVCRRRVKLDVIGEIDVYKCEPWELPEKSLLQTGDKQWFFFSPRDKKYPNGSRSNRATKRGYWKATGKDRCISLNSRSVGLKKTLIFYDGRAPNGKRTDWVMHEYTMDEDELQNCNAVEESYALYKIYRKSGPGPKNGEQYGAPFKEEEWSDDDQICHNMKDTNNIKLPALDVVDIALPNSVLGDNQFSPPMDDFEELLQKLTDDSELNKHYGDDFSEISKGNKDDRRQINFEGPFFQDALTAEAFSEVSSPCANVGGLQHSFNATGSATSLVPCDTPEVTSTFDWPEVEPCQTDWGYMELNDLVDSPTEPSASNLGSNMNPALQLSDIDKIAETEFYFDAPMSLVDVLAPTDGAIQQTYNMDGFCEVATSSLDYHLAALSDDIMYNNAGASQITTELWTQDQNFGSFRSSESSQFLAPPPDSGIVEEGSVVVATDEIQQWQNNAAKERDDGQSKSWLTSRLYSLLESIPSHPASASENALINRAFVRMSSFGAVRIVASRGNAGVTAGVSQTPGRGRLNGNGGFLFVACVGVLLAVLWLVMLGATVKGFKAFAWKVIS